jgi:hypothetical protein
MFRDSFVALLIAAAACSEPAPEEPPLCRLSTASPETSAEADEEEPDPNAPLPNVTARQWTELLVGTASRAERDCAGEAIRLPRAGAACPADGASATSLPIDESSVTTKRLDAGRRLTFVRTHAVGDEVLGVVALVTQDARALTVEALGHLRTRGERLRLRLETLGEREVVVADAETCANPDDITSCVREVRFLVREEDRFVEPSVYDDEAVCQGAPVLRMAREHDATLPDGWSRSFKLVTSWEIRDGGILIREQVTTEDTKPSEPGLPPRPFRVVDSVRTWRLERERFVTSDRPLWDRMLERNGATDVPAESNGEPR